MKTKPDQCGDMSVDIRLLQPDEGQALEDFLVLCFGESERGLAHRSIACMFSREWHRPTFLMAKDGADIIGAATVSEEMFTVGTWGIGWMCVHPDRRNRGLGGDIVDACLAEISRRAEKTVTAILCTYPDKTGLYDKKGFQKGGQDHTGGWYMVRTVPHEGGNR